MDRSKLVPAYTFAGEDYEIDMDENPDHRIPQPLRSSPFPQVYRMEETEQASL